MVVGLGNPGRRYQATRHNVGFELLDRLAGSTPFESRPRWQAAAAKMSDGTWLLKPGTFMNLSGRSVQAASAFFKLPPESLLVVFDDVSLPLGTLRFREDGGHGGHNGVRSIIESLGSDRFPRLKIGIGASGPGEMVGHVLGRFREDERDALQNTLARAVDAVQLALSQGVAAAANVHNVRNKPPKIESDEPEI